MTSFVNQILDAPALTVYLVVGLVVFAEDALFVGFVIPGETAAILGGVAASRGHVPVVGVLVVVILAAIIGDTVGYEIGRHVGSRLLDLRIFAKRRARLQDAQDFLARRGGSAVLLGRWVAFFRAVMPALAGTARMRYRTFVTFNATGGIIWGTIVVLLGYYAGNSYTAIQHTLGRGAALVVLAVAAVAVVIWQIRRHRHETTDTTPPKR